MKIVKMEEYQVGDKVVIIDRLGDYMGRRFIDSHDVVDEMVKYSGMVATITTVDMASKSYLLDVDDEEWEWLATTIQGKIIFEKGDRVEVPKTKSIGWEIDRSYIDHNRDYVYVNDIIEDEDGKEKYLIWNYQEEQIGDYYLYQDLTPYGFDVIFADRVEEEVETTSLYQEGDIVSTILKGDTMKTLVKIEEVSEVFDTYAYKVSCVSQDDFIVLKEDDIIDKYVEIDMMKALKKVEEGEQVGCITQRDSGLTKTIDQLLDRENAKIPLNSVINGTWYIKEN